MKVPSSHHAATHKKVSQNRMRHSGNSTKNYCCSVCEKYAGWRVRHGICQISEGVELTGMSNFFIPIPYSLITQPLRAAVLVPSITNDHLTTSSKRFDLPCRRLLAANLHEHTVSRICQQKIWGRLHRANTYLHCPQGQSCAIVGCKEVRVRSGHTGEELASLLSFSFATTVRREFSVTAMTGSNHKESERDIPSMKVPSEPVNPDSVRAFLTMSITSSAFLMSSVLS